MDEPTSINIEESISTSLSTIEEAENLLKNTVLSSDQKPLGVKKTSGTLKVEETSTFKLTNEETPAISSRKPNKESLIDSIMELQEKNIPGYEPKPRAHYRKMKVPQVEAILGDLINKSVENINGLNGPKVTDENGIQVNQAENVNMQGSALFQFNMLAAYFLELGSVNYESQMGTSLRGLTDDMQKHKKELEEVLGEIYKEHKEVLDPYLTSTNKYFLLMSGLMTTRLISNRQKKSSDSSDPQPTEEKEDGESQEDAPKT